MSGPQVGDRVRVTYEAEWGGPGPSSHAPKGWVKIDGDHAAWVPCDAEVEVLAPADPSWSKTRDAVALSRYRIARQCQRDGLWHAPNEDPPLSYCEWESRYGPITLIYDPSGTS